MKLQFKKKTAPGRYPWAVNDRDHAARVARIKIQGREVLELDVDFGLYAAQQAFRMRAKARRSLTGTSVAILFHRAVEMLDAVDALLAAGATLPARTVARAMLEAVVYSRYLSLLNDDRVAAAFLSASQLEVIEVLQTVADGHSPGSQPTIEAREAESNFRALLGDQRLWRQGARELERIRFEEGPGTPWFRAFDGPRSISGVIKAAQVPEMSAALGMAFDKWSQTTHCADWVDAVSLEDHSNPDAVSVLLRPLRAVHNDADIILKMCHTLFVIGHRTLAEYFGPEIDGTIDWLDACDRLMRDRQ